MDYKTFVSLFDEAKECEIKETFVHERAWQEWMDDYEDPKQVVEDLAEIYELSKASLLEIRKKYKMSRAGFCRDYKIPIRTVEDWEKYDRLPEYIRCMICYTMFAKRHRPGGCG